MKRTAQLLAMTALVALNCYVIHAMGSPAPHMPIAALCSVEDTDGELIHGPLYNAPAEVFVAGYVYRAGRGAMVPCAWLDRAVSL